MAFGGVLERTTSLAATTWHRCRAHGRTQVFAAEMAEENGPHPFLSTLVRRDFFLTFRECWGISPGRRQFTRMGRQADANGQLQPIPTGLRGQRVDAGATALASPDRLV